MPGYQPVSASRDGHDGMTTATCSLLLSKNGCPAMSLKLALSFPNHCCARGDESHFRQCTQFSLSPFVGKGDSLKYQSEMFS